MSLAATKVTIYFIGLVNFYAPSLPPLPDPLPKIEVIVPRTPPGEKHEGVELKPHRAFVVIRGLRGGEADCVNKLKGTWEDPSCILDGLLGSTITLPSSSPPSPGVYAQSSFRDRLPRLPGLCRDATLDSAYLTDPGKYAIRLTLTEGTLRSCPKDGAWAPNLTLENTSDTFSIDDDALGKRSAPLADNAVVLMMNVPSGPREKPPDDRKHFWWYYKMYKPAPTTTCTAYPMITVIGTECNVVIPHPHEFASGVGCTPTLFP